jgi:hypothetical protein
MTTPDPAVPGEVEWHDDEALASELAAIRKSDLNTATVRTAVPMAWTSVALWFIDRYGINLSLDDLVTLAPLTLVVGGVVYRLSRALEARFPKLAYVLLGSKKTPNFYI